MKILKHFTVHELSAKTRLNTYCEMFIDYFESRKSVKKAIKKGIVQLNDCIVDGGTWLKTGDKITIVDLELAPPKTYEINIPVIYEDDYLAIVNKPAGITVSGNQFKTLYNTLGYNLTRSEQANALPWPLPAHRLDNQTSGLVLIAKTTGVRIALGALFEKKRITKTYKAIVMGRVADNMKSKGQINLPIAGKRALTHFKVLSETRSLKNDWLSLVELSPLTGRTHQLRIHLAEIQTPILGDRLYASQTIKHKGLFLCACGLEFEHPISKQLLKIRIDLPYKFTKRLTAEQARWRKYKES